jgi:chromate transporter
MIFLELFLTFFKIGAFTFGGGYAMLPLIKEEVAARWSDVISNEAMVNFIAVSESTPGPFAINMATYIGSQMGGILGAACATLGVVLPSFIIILIVAKCYEKFKSSRLVKGCMSGLKPAVVGLIGAAALDIAGTVLAPVGWSLAIFSGVGFYVSLAIFTLCAVLAFKKVHPILIICIAAAIGIATGYLL